MSTEPNATGRLSFPEYDEEGLRPAKQVTRLRKEGKLVLAYRYAQQELDDNPEDECLVDALGWVYYDYLKQQHDKINTDRGVERFIHILETIDQFETTYSISLDGELAGFFRTKFISSAWELQKAGISTVYVRSSTRRVRSTTMQQNSRAHFSSHSRIPLRTLFMWSTACPFGRSSKVEALPKKL